MAAPRNKSKIAERLMDIKEELEQKKEERSELQGELRGLLARMKDEFNVDGLDEADKRLEEMGIELEQMEEQLANQMEVIEELM